MSRACHSYGLRRSGIVVRLAIMAAMLIVRPSVANCAEHVEAPILRGDFSIGREGRLIFLPVRIEEREHQFLVDTGACRSCVDTKLRAALGTFRGHQLLKTPAGIANVETFDWPDASIGEQPLRSKRPIACFDLTELRQASNTNVVGIIGMDVLINCRMQIDFDRGLLRFLESIPIKANGLGAPIPLEVSAEGAPHCRAELADESTELFLIDTGAQGNSLQVDRFDELLNRKLIRLGGTFKSVTAGGEVQGNRGRIPSLTLGPYRHRALRVARLNISSLGIRHLSRFLVTFDFPERLAYLRPGESYSKREPQATSGLALYWVDGVVTVKSIRESGPAVKAGIRPDDVLLLIDGKAASSYDHFTLRQLLMYEIGRTVPLRIRRGDAEFSTDLELEED